MRRSHRRTRLLGTVLGVVSVVAAGSVHANATSAPDGEPIKLMSIYVADNPAFSQPQTFAGAQARVDAINAAGGHRRAPDRAHRLRLQPRPEPGAGVHRPGHLRRGLGGGQLEHLLHAAHGTRGSRDPVHRRPGHHPGPIEQSDLLPVLRRPGMVPRSGGDRGRGRRREHHVVTGDTASSQYSESIALAAIEAAGLTPNPSVVAAVGRADYTAEAAAAIADNPDAVLMNGPAEVLTKFTRRCARPATGPDRELRFGHRRRRDRVARRRRRRRQGVAHREADCPTPRTPYVAQFIEEMSATDPDASQDELAEYGWSSVYLFGEVMADADRVRRRRRRSRRSTRSPSRSTPVCSDRSSGSGTPVSPDTPRLFTLSYIDGEVVDGVLGRQRRLPGPSRRARRRLTAKTATSAG